VTGLAPEVQIAIALLAFTVAFYGLVGREHKTPYITARALSTVYWILVSLVLLGGARISTALWPGEARAADAADLATLLARAILGTSFLYLVYSVFKVANRRTHFRDDIWKNVSLVRAAKALRRRLRTPAKYQYGVVHMGGPLLDQLKQNEYLRGDSFTRALASSENGSIAAAFRAESLSQADDLLIELAQQFLANKGCVQYATCARHPSEFLHHLKTAWGKTHAATPWSGVRRQVVAIDAYSPHFGFTDTVHPVRLKQIEGDCLALIRSAPTYAGLHTAASQAFNKLMEFTHQQGQDYRNPALVIYEAPHALVDLESPEQYRIFVRHVIPSERMWGGMFTLFVEPSISDDSWKLLQSYADVVIATKQSGRGVAHG
jgi:hypothetical protein